MYYILYFLSWHFFHLKKTQHKKKMLTGREVGVGGGRSSGTVLGISMTEWGKKYRLCIQILVLLHPVYIILYTIVSLLF